MAACRSLQHIFENSLPPDNQKPHSTWNQIKPIEQSSFTEIFGELHFKENSSSSSSSSSSSRMSSFIDFNSQTSAKQSTIFDKNCEDNSKTPLLETFSSSEKTQTQYSRKKSENLLSMNHENLQLCTEGLGFESSDDVEDMINGHWEQEQEERAMRTTKQPKTENPSGELKRSRAGKGAFPPPISCIGESGKPWVCFKSYRQDGRFILKEIRTPSPEFLHACREGGRLKLHFVQPNSEILEEEEDDDEDEDNDDDDEGNRFMEDEDDKEIGQQ
ncbi:hypothetical protein HS088_TW02G00734 [Tripterygium wilfordii]|uniref:FAF domain-containing protein n=1 Tax=Tripterygium wilfordii TaxID=458696 RepID=A0A7J7DZH3_TRIWF|nr:protein FANTASTIC FOUR 3-like [Tripterygium wilfordii]KAF5751717.1 hypothetical protein HS088_TW02G00734 [Tripterygium wilfordii]